MIHLLSDDWVAAAAQALDHNGFAAFTGIHGTCGTASQCANNRPAKSVSIVVGLAKNCASTSAQDGCTKRFLVKLALVACQGLASAQIALKRGGRCAVENRCVVRATVGAGPENQSGCKREDMWKFHGFVFLSDKTDRSRRRVRSVWDGVVW